MMAEPSTRTGRWRHSVGNAVGRLAARLAPESRAGVPFFAPAFGVAATRVDARIAENLSTVVACVNAVASGVATLPAYVYRAEAGGRVEAPNHPVARLLRQPNERQTWPDFCEWLLAQVLLHGNAVAAIQYDGAGRPISLAPLPWQYIQPLLLPSNQLAFDVAEYIAPWGGSGMPRRFLASDCLHLKDRSDDSWLGRSRISRAPSVLASATGLAEFSSAIWRNAAAPSGAVELPQKISQEGMRRMRAWFDEQYTGAHQGKRVVYLDAGTKFTPISVSPEDAQVLGSRQFSVIEIARLFGVPPPIIGDYTNNTFTNAATASLWFATNTLAPWARKIEAEFGRQLFADSNYSLEIDLSGLTRGDYATRWTANVAAVTAGILTVDEVRDQEGYGPLPAPAGELPGQGGDGA